MARAWRHTVLDRLTDLRKCSKGVLKLVPSNLRMRLLEHAKSAGNYSSGVPAMGKSRTAILPFVSRSRPGA
jgi:hypothetical protein